MVEPVDVGHRGELDVVETAPGALRVDQLPLVEPVERLGHRIVVAVALGSDRGDDVVVSEAFGVADAEILDAPVAVMDQLVEVAAGSSPVPHGHLQRVDRQITSQRS